MVLILSHGFCIFSNKILSNYTVPTVKAVVHFAGSLGCPGLYEFPEVRFCKI